MQSQKPECSGMIWSYGIFNFHAIDNNKTLYIAATNRGLNYFTDSGVAGHRIAAPYTIGRGLRNGTIVAIDLSTAKVKWQHTTEFPPRVSLLGTNAGYIPYTEKTKGSHHISSTIRSGVVLIFLFNYVEP